MSSMQILDVPTASITDVKKSPGAVFDLAADANNAVYVFNRGTVSGVMLTKEQYESLNRQIEDLEDRLIEAETARRLSLTDVKTYSDASVRGKAATITPVLDDSDGWE
jgi:PHD/YefM family antitoxin component YafN of YafNO toxin-antitoxin module